MQKVISKKFEEFRALLIKNLPLHKPELDEVDIYFIKEGGEYNNGEILLARKSSLGSPIYSTTSTDVVEVSDIDRRAQELAKVLFLDCVATALTHFDVAEHFISIIKLAHNDIRVRDLSDRIEVVYSSIQLLPRSSILTIMPDTKKLVVLKDHVSYEDVNRSWMETNTTYYSKYSEGPVISCASIAGMLSEDPSFSHSTKLYASAFKVSMKSIVEIINALNSEEKTTSFRLKSKLVNLPPSQGKAYEEVLFEIFYYIFSNCYDEVEMLVQRANEGRLRIRDIIIDNIAPHNNFLKHLNKCGVHYILMDAKNYKKALRTSDIDTFIGYINENRRFGNFGVIVSRKGASKNLRAQQIRKLRDGVEVVILDESDVLNMIDLRALNRDPMSILKEKLRDLSLLA